MENIQVSRKLIENTQKYFREAAKVIYFNRLRFSQWKGYYNVFKAASMINIPSSDVLNFARTLVCATVILTSKEESVEYDNCKEDINTIVSAINTPREVLAAENSVVMPKQMVFSKLA